MRVSVRTVGGLLAAPVVATLVFASPALATAKPNSNIVGSGHSVKYSPTSLNVKWSGPTEKKCTSKVDSFTITNTAKTSETVTYQGKTFAVIKPGKVEYICVWGSGTASATLGLAANKNAKLAVHVS